MDDIERIHRICEKLELVWMCYPHLRLTQLLENHATYVSDDELEERLETILSEKPGGG